MTHSGPSASRSGLISWADATQPSRPASRARSARCSTWAFDARRHADLALERRRSRLVSTGHAEAERPRHAEIVRALRRRLGPARIIARPPLA
jgi:hypothetical protein